MAAHGLGSQRSCLDLDSARLVPGLYSSTSCVTSDIMIVLSALATSWPRLHINPQTRSDGGPRRGPLREEASCRHDLGRCGGHTPGDGKCGGAAAEFFCFRKRARGGRARAREVRRDQPRDGRRTSTEVTFRPRVDRSSGTSTATRGTRSSSTPEGAGLGRQGPLRGAARGPLFVSLDQYQRCADSPDGRSRGERSRSRAFHRTWPVISGDEGDILL